MYMINNEYSISLFSFSSLWSWLEIDVLVNFMYLTITFGLEIIMLIKHPIFTLNNSANRPLFSFFFFLNVNLHGSEITSSLWTYSSGGRAGQCVI